MLINPTYVTFEQAKWLKEKGFGEKCTHLYNESDGTLSGTKMGMNGYPNKYSGYIAAPEQWQVIEWLRINYGIWIVAWRSRGIELKFYFEIDSLDKSYVGDIRNGLFNSPQEAYSAAFDYIIENKLI